MASRSEALLMSLILAVCGVFDAAASELSGTSWQLVKIMSMNDRVGMPDDCGGPAKVCSHARTAIDWTMPV